MKLFSPFLKRIVFVALLFAISCGKGGSSLSDEISENIEEDSAESESGFQEKALSLLQEAAAELKKLSAEAKETADLGQQKQEGASASDKPSVHLSERDLRLEEMKLLLQKADLKLEELTARAGDFRLLADLSEAIGLLKERVAALEKNIQERGRRERSLHFSEKEAWPESDQRPYSY